MLAGIRYIYYFLLLTHIVLAAINCAVGAFSPYCAAFRRSDIPRHRKIARITWPIWFLCGGNGCDCLYYDFPLLPLIELGDSFKTE